MFFIFFISSLTTNTAGSTEIEIKSKTTDQTVAEAHNVVPFKQTGQMPPQAQPDNTQPPRQDL